MAELSEKIFARADIATLTANGTAYPCRGVITAINSRTDETGSKRHRLGVLSRPMYKFVGSAPLEVDLTNAQLLQANTAYTVLDSRRLMLGGRLVAVRLLLERRDENELDELA